MSGVKDHAVMWDNSSTGVGANPGFIMNNLAERIDKFLVEFLRVNEVDCQPSRP